MLTPFWNWVVIIVSIGSILACWWLLHWTKGISDREVDDEIDDTGHVWDNDIRELNNPLPRWWLHMFNLTIVFALVYLVLFPGLGNFPGVLGWTQLKKYDTEMVAAQAEQEEVFAVFTGMSPDQLMANDEAMDIGRRLFGNNCAMCHGSDAQGGKGFPNLTDDVWQWGEGYDAVLTAINKGRQAAMPVMIPNIEYSQSFALAQYVRSLSGLEHEASQAAAGQQDFNTYCVACHMPDGSGNQALGSPNLTDDYWLYGSSTNDIIERIEQGGNGNMPAHENLIGEEQRKILAAYVLSLSR